MKLNKLHLMAGAMAIMIPAISFAATTDIDVTATFLAAINLGNEVNMDFGIIEFTGAPTMGDRASLGTNGAIAYNGNFSGAGTGTAGAVEIVTGNVGATVEVFCDTTATLTRTGGGAIDAVGIEVSFGAPAAYGAGSACQGPGVAATSHDLAGGDVMRFGGQIDGDTAAAFVGGSYSTANADGNDIEITVNYQ
ncbi:MAG: hypothetical protein ACK4VI_08315 [Alphaproteobacteria bacterium]